MKKWYRCVDIPGLASKFYGRSGGFPIPSIHVALQHHEKYDGTGYPRGLAGTDIHEFSRIVSMVDVYDAVTSDRPYRKALFAHEAYELMLVSGSQHFDPEILPIFFGQDRTVSGRDGSSPEYRRYRRSYFGRTGLADPTRGATDHGQTSPSVPR